MSIDFQSKYAFAFEDSDEEDYSFLPSHQPSSQPSGEQPRQESAVISWGNETEEHAFNAIMSQPVQKHQASTNMSVKKNEIEHATIVQVETKDTSQQVNVSPQSLEKPFKEGGKNEYKKTQNVSQNSELENLVQTSAAIEEQASKKKKTEKRVVPSLDSIPQKSDEVIKFFENLLSSDDSDLSDSEQSISQLANKFMNKPQAKKEGKIKEEVAQIEQKEVPIESHQSKEEVQVQEWASKKQRNEEAQPEEQEEEGKIEQNNDYQPYPFADENEEQAQIKEEEHLLEVQQEEEQNWLHIIQDEKSESKDEGQEENKNESQWDDSYQLVRTEKDAQEEERDRVSAEDHKENESPIIAINFDLQSEDKQTQPELLVQAQQEEKEEIQNENKLNEEAHVEQFEQEEKKEEMISSNSNEIQQRQENVPKFNNCLFNGRKMQNVNSKQQQKASLAQISIDDSNFLLHQQLSDIISTTPYNFNAQQKLKIIQRIEQFLQKDCKSKQQEDDQLIWTIVQALLNIQQMSQGQEMVSLLELNDVYAQGLRSMIIEKLMQGVNMESTFEKEKLRIEVKDPVERNDKINSLNGVVDSLFESESMFEAVFYSVVLNSKNKEQLAIKKIIQQQLNPSNPLFLYLCLKYNLVEEVRKVPAKEEAILMNWRIQVALVLQSVDFSFPQLVNQTKKCLNLLSELLVTKKQDLNGYIILRLISGSLNYEDMYKSSPQVSTRTNLSLNYLATFIELVLPFPLSNEWKMQLSWDRYITYQYSLKEEVSAKKELEFIMRNQEFISASIKNNPVFVEQQRVCRVEEEQKGERKEGDQEELEWIPLKQMNQDIQDVKQGVIRGFRGFFSKVTSQAQNISQKSTQIIKQFDNQEEEEEKEKEQPSANQQIFPQSFFPQISDYMPALSQPKQEDSSQLQEGEPQQEEQAKVENQAKELEKEDPIQPPCPNDNQNEPEKNLPDIPIVEPSNSSNDELDQKQPQQKISGEQKETLPGNPQDQSAGVQSLQYQPRTQNYHPRPMPIPSGMKRPPMFRNPIPVGGLQTQPQSVKGDMKNPQASKGEQNKNEEAKSEMRVRPRPQAPQIQNSNPFGMQPRAQATGPVRPRMRANMYASYLDATGNQQ